MEINRETAHILNKNLKKSEVTGKSQHLPAKMKIHHKTADPHIRHSFIKRFSIYLNLINLIRERWREK